MKWMKFLERLDQQRAAVRSVPNFQKTSIPADHHILAAIVALVDEAIQGYEAPETVTVALDADGHIIIPEGMRTQGVDPTQTDAGTVQSSRIYTAKNILPKGTSAKGSEMLPREANMRHVNRDPVIEDATQDTVVK